MSLDGQKDVVLWAQLARIVGGAGTSHQWLALAQKLHPVLFDRSEIGSSRNERNIASRQRQLDADVAADRAGAKDADFHAAGSASPSFMARPMRCSFPVAPFGISRRKIIFRGTLNSARWRSAKSFSSRSLR